MLENLLVSDMSNIVSAAANVVMAAGVVIAAKSFRTQKKIHLIDLHTRYQQAIRNIQEKLPHDINERIVLTREERRIIRLYWYTVFDEWFTCGYLFEDRELNGLWSNFAWGAKSGIEHIPAFASEFVRFRSGKPYLLGTYDKFFQELEAFFIKHNQINWNSQRCILLYGAPCSGKSTVATVIEATGWGVIKIDSVIRQFVAEPAMNDFSEYAEEITMEIYRQVLTSNGKAGVIIELGCLFPRGDSEHLCAMLRLVGMTTNSVKMQLREQEAKLRAATRNHRIKTGQSDDIVIDDIDNLGNFFRRLELNAPADAIIIDGMAPPEECAERIIGSLVGCRV